MILYFQKQTDFGDVMFSLSYLPTAERLTVVMVKARSLKWCNDKTAGSKWYPPSGHQSIN